MWLTRIERAFDTNYAPAYIAIAFLIPYGRQPKGEAMLKLITDTLAQNHSNYIRQSVIQTGVDWRFLEELSGDLEAYLTSSDTPLPPKALSPKYGVAYSEDDITTLLDNLWDERIAQCRMVFCGRGILTADKEFVCIEELESKCDTYEESKKQNLDVVFPVTDKQNQKVTNVGKKKPKRKLRTPYKVYLVSFAVVVALLIAIVLFKNVFKDGPLHEQLAVEMTTCYIEMRDCDPRYCGDAIYQTADSLNAEYGKLSETDMEEMKSYFSYHTFDSVFTIQKNRRIQDMDVYQQAIEMLDKADLRNWNEWKQRWNSLMENADVLTEAHDDILKTRYDQIEYQREQFEREKCLYERCVGPKATRRDCEEYLRRYPNGMYVHKVKEILSDMNCKVRPSSRPQDSERPTNTHSEKRIIKSAEELFMVLTWENIREFDEKFEVGNPKLRMRARNIVMMAMKVGRERYRRIYMVIQHQNYLSYNDKLLEMEKMLDM